jgi:hypothetical protein
LKSTHAEQHNSILDPKSIGKFKNLKKIEINHFDKDNLLDSPLDFNLEEDIPDEEEKPLLARCR